MGGVSKLVSKVFGGSTTVAEQVTSKAQSTMMETFDDVKNSDRKKRKQAGAKKLQIPTQSGGVQTSTGGTGLGTGV